MYIYALKLEHGKYYCGKTNNVEERIKQHYNGEGAAYTKLHKPIDVLFTCESTSTFDEDKYTKELMLKYGIDAVRGASYVLPILEPSQISLLQKEIWSCTDKCMNCGGNHFISDCKTIKDKNGNVI